MLPIMKHRTFNLLVHFACVEVHRSPVHKKSPEELEAGGPGRDGWIVNLLLRNKARLGFFEYNSIFRGEFSTFRLRTLESVASALRGTVAT